MKLNNWLSRKQFQSFTKGKTDHELKNQEKLSRSNSESTNKDNSVQLNSSCDIQQV